MSEQTKEERVAELQAYFRKRHLDAIALIDRSKALLERLPESVLEQVGFSEDWIQISSPTREQVEAALSALNAGQMKKSLCHSNPTLIDYEGVVDGVRVIIHAAKPPASCRIEPEEVYVPAHNKTVLKLVCA